MKELDGLIVTTVENYLKTNFKNIVKECFDKMAREHSLISGQEFLPIEVVAEKYGLSVRTLYNYHTRKYITLRTSEGKTFVSILEMENHIRNHEVVRLPGNAHG